MNFRMKVYGHDKQGRRVNKLVGVSGLIALIGAERFAKWIAKAFAAGLDKFVCKLRNTLKVTFYGK